MKFWDPVMTKLGPGNVIGMLVDGSGILVSIRREDLIGKVCTGPCLNTIVKWSEVEMKSLPQLVPDGER